MAVPEAPKRPAKAKPPAKREPAASAATAIAVNDVAKAFGATRAIRSASMDLREGEVHCIVGENGSGKSTLVKILAGVHRPDSGTFDVGGETRDMLRNPQASLAAGISVVFQEVLVVEPRSVLENVWLGTDEIKYPHTIDGLADCYLAAVPFFRGTLIGDWLFGLTGMATIEGLPRVWRVGREPTGRAA